METRTAALQDLDAVAAVEAACFPAVEAATKEEFAERLRYYGSHFWLMFDGGNLIGFVDGMVTDQADLTDDLYEQAALHNERGAWQMIFGVNTLPAYRPQGVAAALIRRPLPDAQSAGPQRAGPDLQGSAGSLLCQIRVCQRRRVRIHPRRRGVVSDAADLLRSLRRCAAWEFFRKRCDCGHAAFFIRNFSLRKVESDCGALDSP